MGTKANPEPVIFQISILFRFQKGPAIRSWCNFWLWLMTRKKKKLKSPSTVCFPAWIPQIRRRLGHRLMRSPESRRKSPRKVRMTKRNPSGQRRLAIFFVSSQQLSLDNCLLFEVKNPLQTGKKVQERESGKQEKGEEKQEGRTGWWDKGSWKEIAERCKEGANTYCNILQIVWVHSWLKMVEILLIGSFPPGSCWCQQQAQVGYWLDAGLGNDVWGQVVPQTNLQTQWVAFTDALSVFQWRFLAVFEGVCFSGGSVSKLQQQNKQFQIESKILSNLHQTKGWEVCAVGTGGCRGKEAGPWGSSCFP